MEDKVIHVSEEKPKYWLYNLEHVIRKLAHWNGVDLYELDEKFDYLTDLQKLHEYIERKENS